MKNFSITTEHILTNENISDLMVTALEGGINYWCGKVTIDEDEDGLYLGVSSEDQDKVVYVSDAIGFGGSLTLYDVEEDDGPWNLTEEAFVSGVILTMLNNGYYSIDDLMDNQDADIADQIIQYALFKEIVFG